MPTATLTLPTQTTMGAQRVYVKSLWTDPWVEYPGLWSSGFSWGCLPQIGAASLEHRAFVGALQHENPTTSTYHAWQSLDLKFIKIEYDHQDSVLNGSGGVVSLSEMKTRRWFGFVDMERRAPEDLVLIGGTRKGTGDQSLGVTGIEQIWDDTLVLNGFFKKTSGEATIAVEIKMAPTFNEGRKPNRSDVKVNGSYVFSQYSQNASYWSTKDIVEYLLRWHKPRMGNGSELCQVINMRESVLFDWDKPEIEAHGRSVWSILCELLHARRGLGAYFEPNSDPAAPWLFYPFTHAIGTVVLSDDDPNQKLFANSQQYNLSIARGLGLERDARPDLVTLIDRRMESQYHRVVVQGARRRSCFTINKTSDSTLDRDWTDADKTAYDNAASTAGDYPADVPGRQKRNKHARTSDELAHVFARFKLPDTFNGCAKGGNGGEAKRVFDDVLPYNADNPESVPSNWPLGWRFSRTLPLYEGQDYSGTTLPKWPYQTSEKAEPKPLAPMVFLPQGGSKFLAGDVHGMVSADKKFSLHVQVADSPPRLIFDTHGAPQHAIGKNDWTPLGAGHGDSADEAKYDWDELVVTICVEESRYAEVIYPPALANGGNDIGVLRTKYIDCGNRYKLDYVAGNTVVACDKVTSELKRCTAAGGYVRDDRNFLMQIARAAYEFYRRPRVSASIQKSGATGDLWLGMLIEQLGVEGDDSTATQPMNTVVTQVSLSFPEAQALPVQRWTTTHAEIDGLAFLR